MMRALSLWQPWATFIADGWKKVETRSWTTPYRGPIAIHAAKTEKGLATVERLIEEAGLEAEYFSTPSGAPLPHDTLDIDVAFPRGVVVALADLADNFVVDGAKREGDELHVWKRNYELPLFKDAILVHRREGVLGDLSTGRAAWILENVRPLARPYPLKGRQGLWTLYKEAESALSQEAILAAR